LGLITTNLKLQTSNIFKELRGAKIGIDPIAAKIFLVAKNLFWSAVNRGIQRAFLHSHILRRAILKTLAVQSVTAAKSECQETENRQVKQKS